MRGVVAAGHPLTARAGADVLRGGGNAVDAAVAAVLMSFVAESPLTGPGAGGFMLVLGLGETLERFCSSRLSELTEAPARAAREGVEVVPMQAFLFEVLEPILTSTPECAAIYAPQGRLLKEGDMIRLPELADLLDRLGAEGPGFLYSGDVAAAVSDWVLERGGMLSRDDLGSYGVIEREPARVTYRGREVLTNPPPSSGGMVPGTGMHLNNMLGEQDLNPLGFHRHTPGARVPSMMAPTVVLSEGRPEIAIGSAGSNRIRSAILQTVLGVVDHGLPAQDAVSAPRLHVEERQGGGGAHAR